nr:heterogeneous nuclear ribonucleoprotein 1 [Tanacetum cinerariifolium]
GSNKTCGGRQYAGRTNLVKGSDQNLGSLFVDGNSGVLTKGTGNVVESTMGVVGASASEPCKAKMNFRSLYSDNLCNGVDFTIPRKASSGISKTVTSKKNQPSKASELPSSSSGSQNGKNGDPYAKENMTSPYDSSNILVSNTYACLNEDSRDEVENVFDEYANLLSSANLGESSSPLANEVLAWYRQRKKELMVFKVDFEKAFDSLRRDFLDVILDKLGFGSKWRAWIRGCLHNARSFVLINGSPTEEFELFKDEFNNHFGKYGDITDSVIMKDRMTGQPRGFGFITYVDPFVVDKVIQDTHVFSGKQVEIKRTILRETANSKGFKTKKIFVRGIPSEVGIPRKNIFFVLKPFELAVSLRMVILTST